MTAFISTNGPSVYASDAPPVKLLVATTHGIAVLERDALGAPWHVTGRVLDDKHVSTIMIVPDGGIFAGIHNGGLYHSDDDGATWEPRSNGITVSHVFSLGYRQDGDAVTLYVGTEPVGLFRSRDNGLNWEELPAIKTVPNHERWTFPPPPHFAHTKSFLFDRRDRDTFYVTVEQGALLKTTDGGESWRELESFSKPEDEWYKDCHRLVSRPSNPDEIYMLTGIGLYCSYDAGESWEQRTDKNFRIGYPDQLIMSPLDDRLMLMCGAFAPPTNWRKNREAKGWIMRTRDGGRTWEDANKGLPVLSRSNIEAFTAACYPGGYELYAGNTDGEVYTSTDDGDTWSLLADNLEPVSKGTHFRVIAGLPA